MKDGLSFIGKTIDCECLTIKLCGTCVDLKETCGNVTLENYSMRNSIICALHPLFLIMHRTMKVYVEMVVSSTHS